MVIDVTAEPGKLSIGLFHLLREQVVRKANGLLGGPVRYRVPRRDGRLFLMGFWKECSWQQPTAGEMLSDRFKLLGVPVEWHDRDERVVYADTDIPGFPEVFGTY